ncbi:DUF4404 family protein [Streptomyces sp. BI20]|uniref:DUF4404 family protein n=1 Tax=Streptomyces sp. BI20 TaxID=3403460 RepID=UPI003C74AA60
MTEQEPQATEAGTTGPVTPPVPAADHPTLRELRARAEDPELDEADREHLRALADRVEARTREGAPEDEGLRSGVGDSLARFETTHPRIAATLDSLGQYLSSLGI